MKRDEEANKSATQLVWFITLCAIVITVLVYLGRNFILDTVFGEITPEVRAHANTYLLIVTASIPFIALYNGGAAIFRAMGNSKVSMKVAVIMNVINVVGNAVFILGLKWGTEGVAIPTLVSRMVAAVVIIKLLFNEELTLHVEKTWKYRPNFMQIKKIMKVGIPNSVENSMFQLGRLMTSSLVSTLGTVSIVANSAALSLAGFQYNSGSAIQSTMVAVVGRCIGANEKEQAKYYTKYLLGIGYLIVVAVDIILCIFAKPLLGLYGLSGDSFEVARTLLIFHSVVSALLWPVAFCLPPAFRAASDVRFTMVVSIVSMWTFRVALGYVLALETVNLIKFADSYLISFPGVGLGVMGVWIAMFIDWLFRTILFIWRYVSGKWLTKYKPKV